MAGAAGPAAGWRGWTLAGRGELRADPILFALRDAVSHAGALALLLVFWSAL
ncbi:MAG: hypothetical protein IPH76_01170 [Xanthomonadales bacterium]|nr:hypothetical protein [Xanthomonadales bacterium]